VAIRMTIDIRGGEAVPDLLSTRPRSHHMTRQNLVSKNDLTAAGLVVHGRRNPNGSRLSSRAQ